MRCLLSLALALLCGCGTQVLPDAGGAATGPASARPERAVPADSLAALLIAEFALRRRDYPLALHTYMEQAALLRDPGVSAHTTRLAQFMRRDAEALVASRLWVELAPDNLEARLTLANLLTRAGQPQRALVHMGAILQAGGTANFTALAQGFGQLEAGVQAGLLRDIQALQDRYPDHAQVRLCHVLMLRQSGRLQTALRTLQAVFKTAPLHERALALDAGLRRQLGQRDRAYRRILAALQAQPDNHRLRLQYARLLVQTDLSAARRQFQMLSEQRPTDPDLLLSLALIQRETDELEGARQTLVRLLELGQHVNAARYHLGRTAEQQQRRDAALAHYMAVQPAARDFSAASARIAVLLLQAGQTGELNAWFEHLRAQFSPLAERLFALQADHLVTGRHSAEAITVLQRGLDAFPASTSLRYSRSLLHEQRNDIALAEADLRAILRSEPDNSAALNALGYTLANRTDRYAEAERLIGRALRLEPNAAAILDSMGWVKYRRGDFAAALDYLRQAFSLLPDPEVAAHLGEVLWMSGDQSGARAVWQQALTASPNHEILLETMQRLATQALE